MDGKLIVLCGERPTINENAKRIDEQGNLLAKIDDKYININQEEVKVDEYKKVINGMDLLYDMVTESTDTETIFVDWETIIPSDIQPMQEMIKVAMSTQEISPEMILESGKNKSFLKKAYMDTLLAVSKAEERPCFDYQFQAMEHFMQLFSDAIEKNQVVSILPTFPNADDATINNARMKIIQAWKNRNEIKAKLQRESKIEVLDGISYDEFGEIYSRAMDERLRILSKPDWYDKLGQQEDEGPGGRD